MDEHNAQEVDLLLAQLYMAWTTTAGEFGISVLIGGQWLTGTAITGRMWLEQVAKFIEDSSSINNLGLPFRYFGQLIYPSESEVDAGFAVAPEQDRAVSFLHLRDAKVLYAGSVIPTNGGFVRVKLSAVDGWLFGNIDSSISGPTPP